MTERSRKKRQKVVAVHAGKLTLKPVFLITGLLLIALALIMLVLAAVVWAFDYEGSKAFAAPAALTGCAGGTVVLVNRTRALSLSLRQAFVLTATIWVTLPAFSALPFVFSELELGYTDAFFEAMSGFTTTGLTVIVGPESVAHSLLLWRALLQWLGGIGIILTALLILPVLGDGSMQMFCIQAIEAHERPVSPSLSTGLIGLYVGLTAILTLALRVLGMPGFDAVTHAMTVLSTGGFINSEYNVFLEQNVFIELAIVIGMIVGSLPLLLSLQAVRGTPELLLYDTQVRTFLTTLGIAIVLVFCGLWLASERPLLHAARIAIFATTSLMTGTGYSVGSYWQWDGLSIAILFFVIFIGGCAGSTTGAIKVFRFQILYATAKIQMIKLLRPHGVCIPYYNHRPIPPGVPEAVLGFFFLYAFTFAVVSLLLSLIGLDFVAAFSVTAAAISNVGQGPSVACLPFAHLPDAAKWILSGAMLTGRLELFSMLILFLPNFWRA